ncbi:hypothetical protein F441_01052 [Phytophthora nicotianae CJ01A1]|nr:hypothetical protein PPTG_00916 [Phytophthora nicotianae INRA-310]ETM55838.1 hypothetical protein L914_01008 [Phytophthora nicotianae]ETO85059.1 hypothetical protein F444_01085 [Phytophthora nicotianae P1976]ETP26166.1 hypothetical protein F441_01052 [Phytophthora nicotianae CJ01A1]ETP54163.1 hypothetical protein F442_01024 [Phytophthora nicotianae P10297]ETN24695.1 hypothetical protein PPTG_00916 [Phytophthora nicotianae INRA-310]
MADLTADAMQHPLVYTKGRRDEAVLEILHELKLNGISHRTEKAIESKVRRFEREFNSVLKWLEANRLMDVGDMKNKSEPSAIDSVRKVVPYGAMGSNCFEQSFRVAEFPPALQQKFGEVMLNHTQKSSERVLETGKKLREVDWRCEQRTPRSRKRWPSPTSN